MIMGRGYVPIAEVTSLLYDGEDVSNVIDLLREEGFSPEEVDKALEQAMDTIKNQKSGPASVLDPEELPLLQSNTRLLRDTPVKGTLILTTDRRIVFVTSEGMFKKRYHLRHAYPIRNIKNVRVEKGLLNKTLVIEGYWSDGEKFVLRYDGIKNPENWTEPIKELMKASKLFKQAYEEIIGLINSQEITSFSEIYDILAKYSLPDIGDEELIQTLSRMKRYGQIDGFIDKENKRFVHIRKYERMREIIEYKIVASFKFDENGALLIVCPFCKAPQSLTEKKETVKCSYCGRTFIVPQKILKLI